MFPGRCAAMAARWQARLRTSGSPTSCSPDAMQGRIVLATDALSSMLPELFQGVSNKLLSANSKAKRSQDLTGPH